jgi:hypothetical protein
MGLLLVVVGLVVMAVLVAAWRGMRSLLVLGIAGVLALLLLADPAIREADAIFDESLAGVPMEPEERTGAFNAFLAILIWTQVMFVLGTTARPRNRDKTEPHERRWAKLVLIVIVVLVIGFGVVVAVVGVRGS